MHGAGTPSPSRRRPRCRQRLLAVAAACLAAAACSETKPEPAARPNLLLVTIDTLRADRLACYGGPADVGRFLCSLGESGTRYEWAFSTAPRTAPSIASVLTGFYPARHGVVQNAASYVDDAFATLPELLRNMGYTTAAFVSNPVLDRSKNFAQGFETYDQRMQRHELNRPGFGERDARATVDAALAWAQVRADPPWFLWVHFQDPHGPYHPPGAPAPSDPPGAEPLPVLVGEETGFHGIPAYQVLPGVFTPEAYEARYLEEIRFMDRHLERLVNGLDGLGDAPAVLLTADHGEAFGEDGYYFCHGHSAGLEQIHVPMLWRPAQQSAARVVDRPVSIVDVAPTLLAAAGGVPSPDWPGRPLPADPDAAAADEPRFLFAEHGLRAAVVADGRYYARDHADLRADDSDADLDTDGGLEGHPPAEAGEPPPSDDSETDDPAKRPLPPRTAALEAGGRSPGYEPVDPDAPPAELESALIRHLAEAARMGPGPSRENVSEELRARLRALGYAD